MPTKKPTTPVTPGSVRTTVLLPEALWRAAKMKAIEDRCDLRDIIIAGLECVLAKKGGR